MSFGRVGMRIKWTKLSADESLEEDVLVSMGFHKKSYGSFLGRVRLLEADDDDASLLISDVSLDDMGKFRCEVIDGMEDVLHEVTLEVQGSVGYSDGKSLSFYFLLRLSDGHLISSSRTSRHHPPFNFVFTVVSLWCCCTFVTLSIRTGGFHDPTHKLLFGRNEWFQDQSQEIMVSRPEPVSLFSTPHHHYIDLCVERQKTKKKTAFVHFSEFVLVIFTQPYTAVHENTFSI